MNRYLVIESRTRAAGNVVHFDVGERSDLTKDRTTGAVEGLQKRQALRARQIKTRLSATVSRHFQGLDTLHLKRRVVLEDLGRVLQLVGIASGINDAVSRRQRAVVSNIHIIAGSADGASGTVHAGNLVGASGQRERLALCVEHVAQHGLDGGGGGHVGSGRHVGQHGLQGSQVGGVAQQDFGVVLSDGNLVGHQLGGGAPVGISSGLVGQVVEDRVDHVATGQAAVQGGNDVGLGLGLGGFSGGAADDVFNQVVGKSNVREERGVCIGELRLAHEGIDHVLRAGAGSVSVGDLVHVLNTRSGVEGDREEPVCVGLLCCGQCHRNFLH